MTDNDLERLLACWTGHWRATAEDAERDPPGAIPCEHADACLRGYAEKRVELEQRIGGPLPSNAAAIYERLTAALKRHIMN